MFVFTSWFSLASNNHDVLHPGKYMYKDVFDRRFSQVILTGWVLIS